MSSAGSPETEELRRVLGPLDAACVVIGAIIGVGIFFTPTDVAALAGSGSLALLTWALGGAIALLGALTFAELGGLHTRSGGQYDILRDAYGALPAFVYVFCNATAIQAGAVAIIAVVCVRNLSLVCVGHLPGAGAEAVLAAVLIAGLVGANGAGVRWGASIQNATVLAKLATLALVALLAVLWGGEPVATVERTAAAPPGPTSPVLALVFAGLVPALFSFGGWQHALWIGGEIREPQRNVPRAIVGGVLVVIVVYLLANWAYLRLLGYEGVRDSQALAADAVAAVWPQGGGRIVAAAVALSALGVLNAQFLSGPRLLFAMARDGRFFRPFAHVSERFKTPFGAIVLIGCAALVLLFGAGEQRVRRLLTGVVFIDVFFFVLTGLAVIVLRHKRPDVARPARVPLYPLVPLLFVAGELCALVGAHVNPDHRIAAFIGAGWIVGAALCYVVFFRSRPA
ncbi:MAG: amino acid permease [Planctomycetota bacterium]